MTSVDRQEQDLPDAKDSAATPPRRIDFLDLLRGPAALCVVWDHLAATWPDQSGKVWPPAESLRTHLLEPLGIIQDLGAFGVCLFFLISGYVITHVAQRETRGEFLLKRLFRIYPPLIVSILLTVAIESLRSGGIPWIASEILLSFTLANYLIVPQIVIQGVAWTLVIEVVFYALIWLMMPLARNHARTLIVIQSSFVALVVLESRNWGPELFLFSVSASYLPFLLVGQTLYQGLHTRKLGFGEVFAAVLVQLALAIYGFAALQPELLKPGNSFLLSFVYALLVFLGAQLYADRLIVPGVARRAADLSYSLYLLHPIVGFAVLDGLAGWLRFDIAFWTAVLAVVAASWLCWVSVERPSQALGRRLAQKLGALNSGKRP